MKGIILAGGSGTRLHPMTLAASKQLLPVYDKPMVYYPLGTLMLAGIQDILLISTPTDLPSFQRLLGDGSQFGVRLSYAEQPSPDGLAQAFHIGADFLKGGPAALALGDNIIYGEGLSERLMSAREHAMRGKSTVFGYRVADPERYGVAEFNDRGEVISLEEKPTQPKSDWAVIGLYFYDNRVTDLSRQIKPSARGELEITDLNALYMQDGTLRAEQLGRGCAWLDAGTPASLLQAATFVQTVQERQGLQVSCPEEIAFRRGFLSADALRERGAALGKTAYGRYLIEVADGVHG
ncbi:glucose-1-phosphate thymidylyltransferase RfbA [Sabulicella rubraurantiaca]|uniref:glucose-1-phosphate thymidylyltransferase RfbA n=1 Tax=Sabulicella rubraurantiaca TaxID=2811429 RepID=UPI001A961060|nr:glucose-1-phosphate thymidylyltransferase RfbA [Sabulicella rubraurantiaca]